MITTLDKVKCKRGETVWEVGISSEGYRPTRSIVHGLHGGVANPKRCWKDYEQALKYCEQLNTERVGKGNRS